MPSREPVRQFDNLNRLNSPHLPLRFQIRVLSGTLRWLGYSLWRLPKCIKHFSLLRFKILYPLQVALCKKMLVRDATLERRSRLHQKLGLLFVCFVTNNIAIWASHTHFVPGLLEQLSSQANSLNLFCANLPYLGLSLNKLSLTDLIASPFTLSGTLMELSKVTQVFTSLMR